MNAIEIDAALALVALSRMRQHEKQQRQQAASSTGAAASHARRSDNAGVTTLSFANPGDAAHGATIRVRQKH